MIANGFVFTKIGNRIGMKALKNVAHIVPPQTIMAWFRTLGGKNVDGSKKRTGPGRPSVDPEIVALILRMAEENPTWGYDRIAGRSPIPGTMSAIRPWETF